MKKIISYIITIIILLGIFFILRGVYKNQYIKVKDANFEGNIKYKGLKGAIDFAVDESGKCYIAYNNKIQVIDSNGKSYNLFVDKDVNIDSLDYFKNKLYFSSEDKVYCYDLAEKSKTILIKDLPNYGDYKDSKVRVYNDQLYVTIGSATNSGVVGNDNPWLSDSPFFYDLSPKDITLKGSPFGTEKTGAFVPYKTKNNKGQIIPNHFPGNASVAVYNLKTSSFENFAWGIRNIKGLDFNSEGKLYTTVGGIENRGLRPVAGDVDYIYEINKNVWYGWPDYSGGDPVSSPRFRNENKNKTEFILENHPSSNPPAPLYQHKSINSLGAVAVDANAQMGNKDCIYFYDKRDNMIYSLSKGNALSEKVHFSTKSNITEMRIVSKELLVLDSGEGYLYTINKLSNNTFPVLNKALIYYLMTVIIITIAIIFWKFNFNAKEK